MPLIFATASAVLCAYFSYSTVRYVIQPRSDFRTADEYRFDYTTSALEHNSRYPNGRRTIDLHLLGFRFNLDRLVLYPRWISHGDNQTIEWGPVATWAVSVPGWACIVLTAILPTRQLATARRRRIEDRTRRGICTRCGYDLRASPERCPECGLPRPKPG